MNLYVYPTDLRWFEFLGSRADIDEVNFWQPGGGHIFSRLEPGEVFLFRLKSPINMIGGGGTFVHGSIYPLNAAWDAFGEKNGTADPTQFVRMIASYRHVTPWEALPLDTPIGCIILADPFFWPREQWLPIPSDYHPNLVQGKRYDATSGTGRVLLDAVAARMHTPPAAGERNERISEPALRWATRLGTQRLGQGAFRVLIADLYDRRCAVTGERTLPVLQAAHIRPVTRGGDHNPSNGLLLRSDVHTLFDLGYVTVQPGGRFRVSSRLREAWSNGRVYYALDNSHIRAPHDPAYAPPRDLLEWHNDTVFRG